MLKKISNLKYKLLITLGLIVLVCILYKLPFGCIFYTLTGVRCLGCGMTRALRSALMLDFASAFSYHYMVWSMPILYLCFLKDGDLFKNKKANKIFYILLLIGFVINWVIHQFFEFF